MAKKKKITTKSSYGDETTIEVEDTTEVEDATTTAEEAPTPKPKLPTNSSTGMFGLDEELDPMGRDS